MASANTIYLITGGNRGASIPSRKPSRLKPTHNLPSINPRHRPRPRRNLPPPPRHDPNHTTSRAPLRPPQSPDQHSKLDSKSPTDPHTAISTLQSTPRHHTPRRRPRQLPASPPTSPPSRPRPSPPSPSTWRSTASAHCPSSRPRCRCCRSRRCRASLSVSVRRPGGSAAWRCGRFRWRRMGPPQAVLHWFVRKIHLEHEGLISLRCGSRVSALGLGLVSRVWEAGR